jgi:MFS family permease
VSGPIPAPPPPAPPGQRGLLAAIACIALFGVCQGMTHPLFALRLEADGWPSAMVGLSGAMVALASLTLVPFMPPLIRALGLPRFLSLGALFSSAMLLSFPLFENYWAWLGLRYLQGVAAAMLFVGSEIWIVADSEEGSRGRVVGFYATVLSLGFAAGPMILSGVGVDGATPFAVCAALSLICLAPLLTAWGSAPAVGGDDRPAIPPLRFLRTDPSVIGAVILFGAVEFGVLALLPVWGVKIGMGREEATFLVSALVLGNVALQIPLGALADRWNRRALLIGCGLTSVVAAVALPMLAEPGWPLWTLLFVWGGLVAGLYTVSLVELGARYRGAELVSANAAVVTGYGLGALAGPLVVGLAMDVVEPHGLSLALGAMATAYLGVAVWRGVKRARLTAAGR